ncbi:MAG: hypothetical protein HOP28_06260 [Gemmatimonadales bacterium]|nr:hypothetical protein [Gemmatimonadales bacterium]
MSRTLRLTFLLIGVTLVTVMIWQSGPAELVRGLRSSLWVVAALMPLWAAVYVLNAIAWQLLTSDGGPRLPLWRASVMTVAAFAVNYSTPLASFGGEPLKIIAATKVLGQRRAVGSVVAFRLLHALAHVVAFILALIPALIILPKTPVIVGGIVITGLVLGGITWFLFSRHREGLAVHLLHLLGRVPLLRRLAAKLEPKTAALHEIDEHVTAVYVRNPRRFYLALAVETSARFLALAEYWIILYGMGLGVDPWKAFVVGSFSSLVVNIFIFMPFELGAKEGALLLMFSWLGITPALALQAGMLSRLRELLWIAVGWVLLWVM